MAAYKIISAVIRERVDDSSSDRYLVVAPEDKIVWVTTDGPQDLSPEGRKRAVQHAGLMSLVNKIKREENGVESEVTSDDCDQSELAGGDFSFVLRTTTAAEYEDAEGELLELEEPWEDKKH